MKASHALLQRGNEFLDAKGYILAMKTLRKEEEGWMRSMCALLNDLGYATKAARIKDTT